VHGMIWMVLWIVGVSGLGLLLLANSVSRRRFYEQQMRLVDLEITRALCDPLLIAQARRRLRESSRGG
jgi:hypothetical protein